MISENHGNYLPRPLLPTNRRSLNLATWFFITAVQFLSSPHQFSSLPARIVTIVPSPTSANATTLNATGNVLFERQWFGNAEHNIYGLPVRTKFDQIQINEKKRAWNLYMNTWIVTSIIMCKKKRFLRVLYVVS